MIHSHSILKQPFGQHDSVFWCNSFNTVITHVKILGLGNYFGFYKGNNKKINLEMKTKPKETECLLKLKQRYLMVSSIGLSPHRQVNLVVSNQQRAKIKQILSILQTVNMLKCIVVHTSSAVCSSLSPMLVGSV